MKIAMLYGPRDLRIEDHPLDTDPAWVPTISGSRPSYRRSRSGRTGGNYEGAEQVPGAPDFPRWVGDSNLGVIRGVGDEVKATSPWETGSFQDTRTSPSLSRKTTRVLVKVPDGVHDEDAVYGHLYTLSAMCYYKSHFQPGENVAVVGLGVLGLGAVGLGPCLGARTIGIANSPVRMEMAERMGADATFLYDDPDLDRKLDDFTHGEGVDLVILTANPWPALRTSCQIVRENGRVGIVALPGRGEPPLDFNPLDMEWFYFKGDLPDRGQRARGLPFPPRTRTDRRELESTMCRFTLDLMREGKLEPKRLITHRMHYSRDQ